MCPGGIGHQVEGSRPGRLGVRVKFRGQRPNEGQGYGRVEVEGR